MAPKLMDKVKSLSKKFKDMLAPSKEKEKESTCCKDNCCSLPTPSTSEREKEAQPAKEAISSTASEFGTLPVTEAAPGAERVSTEVPGEGVTIAPASTVKKPVILTIGSSGNVGKATVSMLGSKFLDKVTVKVGVRDPTKPYVAESDTLAANCSLCEADFSKPETLKAALEEVDVVFVITPGTKERTQLVNGAIDAAKEAGVKHIVVISVLSADDASGIFGSQFGPIEAKVKQSGIPYTILRLPLFTDNQWGNKDSIVSQGTIFGPGKADSKYVTISTADIGVAAADILAEPSKHANKTYCLTSELYSSEDLAKAWSAALGREVKYTQVPVEAAKAAMLGSKFEEWQVDGVLELLKAIDAGDPALCTASKDHELITGRPATRIEDWTKLVAPFFV